MLNTATKSYVVLAVDDSPEALGLISRILEPAGMTTLVALDGNQALNIAKKMQPDIVLMDALMPNIDGFDTCLELKKIPELKNVPVIFMTGLSDTESILKGFDAGGIDFLTKPIEPQELVVRMNTHLALARTAMEAQFALDHAGQNVFALQKQGTISWSTPQVEKMLEELEQETRKAFISSLTEWIARSPTKDNKTRFSAQDNEQNTELVAVYIGISDGGDHLIRLINEQNLDERAILKDNFPVTPREADVFVWIAKGKTNREIAQILEMSPRTVNKHLEQLFRKLGVENRTAAATMAMQCLQKNQLF